MNKPSFAPTVAIGFGWETFKKKKLFWIVAIVLQLFVLSGGSITSEHEKDSSELFETSNSVQSSANTEVTVDSKPMKSSYTLQMEPGGTMRAAPEQVHEGLEAADTQDTETPVPLDGSTAPHNLLPGVLLIVFILPLIILVVLISLGVQLGFIKLYIIAGRGQETKYDIILSEMNFGKAFRYLVATVLYVLAVGLGLLLLILPGIYVAIRFGFYGYAMVDRNAGIIESFRLSSQLTKGYKRSLFLLVILAILLNVLGLLAVLYGLLVTIPVSLIAYAYAYDRLSKEVYQGALG
jgi:hypothetical protein